MPQEVGAWLHINAAGEVTAFSGKVEIGQNARTSLTQAVAEELGVPVAAIRFVLADTDLTPFDAGTFGSGTTPRMVPQLRRVAASCANSCSTWRPNGCRVDRATLSVNEGKVVHAASKRSLTFGELAKEQHFTKTVSYDTPVTPPPKWKTEGTSVPKVDGAAIVTGRHRYASDIRLPGMLFGKILRAPSLNAKLKSVDLKAARAMPGVTVVRDGDFVGVAAPTRTQAEEALAAIQAEWTTPEKPASDQHLFEDLKKSRGGSSSGFEGGGARQLQPRLDGERPVSGRPHAQGELHDRLYRARTARAACRRRRVDRREAHRLDGNAAPLRRAGRSGPGLRHSAGKSPRDRARYGLRLRRQTHGRVGHRSGPPRQSGRQTGEAHLDAGRGIHLGLLPSGRRDRHRGGRSQQRLAHRLGGAQLQFGPVGPASLVRHPASTRRLSRVRNRPCGKGRIADWPRPPIISPASAT